MNSKFLELVQDVINKAKDTNICIYGNNGSGKTTLLKEVCKTLNNAIYVDSEDLINDFNNLGKASFKEIYANYDYLLIDNISLLLPRKNLFKVIQDLSLKLISSSPVDVEINNTCFIFLD